jgi:hypothetical protein
VADVDEGLELLGELAVQEKEGICICMSAQQFMILLGEAPDERTITWTAYPQQSRRCLLHKTDRHPDSDDRSAHPTFWWPNHQVMSYHRIDAKRGMTFRVRRWRET